MTDRRVRQTIYLCFLVSGAAGLIYEVVWARQLALFLGITAYAHAAVITAYMAGLAVGSLVLGRLADRTADRLRLYARLEIGVGLYAATTPWLFPWMQSLYGAAAGNFGVTGAGSHLLRFFLALLGLLFPTFLMGGTLPVLVRGLTTRLPALASMTGRLYGINTMGATLGTFAAGYLLLPGLGVRRTILLGVLLNLSVAAAVTLLRRRLPAAKVGSARPAESPASGGRTGPPAQADERLAAIVARLLLVGFAISGFAALVYEIAWIRALTLVVGSSVYAFSITLTTYLAGIGLGSLLYARFLAGRDDRPRLISAGHRIGQAAVLEVLTALCAVIGLPLIGRLPGLFLRGYEGGLHESFVLLQVLIFGFCFLIMFVPTLLLGALFPLLTSLWTRDAGALGRGVGTAYAANTAGTILGSALGGLLLLPRLGIHNSLLLAAALHMLVGTILWFLRSGRTRRISSHATGAIAWALFALAAALLPPWDRAMMTSGAFVNARELVDRQAGEDLRDTVHENELLYYAEGIDGVVTVQQTEAERLLVINGKTDASSETDLPTQILLGQLPMLVHPDPREVLVVGLGSGITTGSVATHATAVRIDVLEISPEVVCASRFFADEHGDVLSDPRVHLIVADARNYLLSSRRTYDVITSEPSNPWISGVSNLFTRDFFELARARLSRVGVMVQWLQTYNMSPLDVRTVFQTYLSVFPHVSVWMPMPGDLLLIGTDQPHPLDYARLETAWARQEICVDLRRIDLSDPTRLLSTFLLGGGEVNRYAADAPVNTDDRPRIEFSAPRSLYGNRPLAALADLLGSLGETDRLVPVSGIAVAAADGLEAHGLGLRVRTEEPMRGGDWRAGWSVTWRVVSDVVEVPMQIAVSGRGFLVWREGDAETFLRASEVYKPSTPEEDRQLLEPLLVGEPRGGGEVKLPGDVVGSWALGLDEENRRAQIGIAWSCRQETGLGFRYVVLRNQADPGPDHRESAMLDLADRFLCTK